MNYHRLSIRLFLQINQLLTYERTLALVKFLSQLKNSKHFSSMVQTSIRYQKFQDPCARLRELYLYCICNAVKNLNMLLLLNHMNHSFIPNRYRAEVRPHVAVTYPIFTIPSRSWSFMNIPQRVTFQLLIDINDEY